MAFLCEAKTHTFHSEEWNEVVADATAAILNYMTRDCFMAKGIVALISQPLTRYPISIQELKRFCEVIGIQIGDYTMRKVLSDIRKGSVKQTRVKSMMAFSMHYFIEEVNNAEIKTIDDLFKTGFLGSIPEPPLLGCKLNFATALQALLAAVRAGVDEEKFGAKAMSAYLCRRRLDEQIFLYKRARDLKDNINVIIDW